jgi:hypothetical protein
LDLSYLWHPFGTSGETDAEAAKEHADRVERKPTPEIIEIRETGRVRGNASHDRHDSDDPNPQEQEPQDKEHELHYTPPR